MKLPLILCAAAMLVACSSEPNNNTPPAPPPAVDPVVDAVTINPNDVDPTIVLDHVKEWCETQQTAETVEFCDCVAEEGAKLEDCDFGIDPFAVPNPN